MQWLNYIVGVRAIQPDREMGAEMSTVTEVHLMRAPDLAAARGIRRVRVHRVLMIGGGNSYDVEVLKSDLRPEDVKSITHYTLRDGPEGHFTEYVAYDQATVTPEHAAMPAGWDKWEDWKRHERAAGMEALAIARVAFPELHRHQADVLPELWVFVGDWPHADAVVEFTWEG